MNKDKLIALCNKFTVVVSFNGFEPFNHKVIDVELLLDKIHTTTDMSKDELVERINSGDFITPEYESIFKSVKSVGEFKTKGQENLSGKLYIQCSDLDWL